MPAIVVPASALFRALADVKRDNLSPPINSSSDGDSCITEGVIAELPFADTHTCLLTSAVCSLVRAALKSALLPSCAGLQAQSPDSSYTGCDTLHKRARQQKQSVKHFQSQRGKRQRAVASATTEAEERIKPSSSRPAAATCQRHTNSTACLLAYKSQASCTQAELQPQATSLGPVAG